MSTLTPSSSSSSSSRDFQELKSVVVRFAGDSGDGIQTVGEQFTDTSALAGNDISTLPDFPAEIRAPAGTLAGVSGFQLQFGGLDILTPGDAPDALVVMNPAALRANLGDLTPGGLLVINRDAFTEANCVKAGYETNPLDDNELEKRFEVIKVNVTELTKEALKDSELTNSQKPRCKNFFALGFMYWVYDRPLDSTTSFFYSKWGKKNPALAAACETVLKAGYYFGETTEISRNRYRVAKAAVSPGLYRKISGNEALTLGLITASVQADRPLFYSGYPITPASPILEGLAARKRHGVRTIQAEDEIAAIGMALGASFAGNIGVTATSGPGMCLKSEFLGLATITEFPLIVCNIQRGGPSTGLPTKTEQSDLLQAFFGRHGDTALPLIAASSPADCYRTAIEAVRIALKYKTPVVLLSELYIANGSEPWRIPDIEELPDLRVPDPVSPADGGKNYVPYVRDPETLARTQAVPGQRGMEHRVGGLEKDEQGSVNYEPDNHEFMTRIRVEKIERIARDIPELEVKGTPSGRLLVLGWGGTYGAILSAVQHLREEGYDVSSAHLRYLNPFPRNLEQVLRSYDTILIPELNLGQLDMLIRARFLLETVSYPKVQGRPFTVREIEDKILELIGSGAAPAEA